MANDLAANQAKFADAADEQNRAVAAKVDDLLTQLSETVGLFMSASPEQTQGCVHATNMATNARHQFDQQIRPKLAPKAD